MKTTATMFSGGDLFSVGAAQAGYEPIWGIEKFDKIASVARLNDLPVMTADVLDVDFSTLRRPDHLHASPPCPNFSIAKTGAVETELDIAMAEAVCRALVQLKPDTFTLENVVGYRNSRSFALITRCLSDLGYWWDATNLNAADFGVPQTRIRLVVRASRGLLQGYPAPVKWNGWYQAIEDLIPALPDAEFAPWQIARLPDQYKTLITRSEKFNQETSRGNIFREAAEPVHTVLAKNSYMRAFLFAGAGNTNFADAYPGRGMRFTEEPAHTVMAGRGGRKPTAFVMDGQANEGERLTIRQGREPIFTLKSTDQKRPTRAYVGRVVKMTIQALGRFQTVPDSYKGLTVKINGNGFPRLMAQKVLETQSALFLLALKDWPQLMDAAVLFVFGAK